MAKEALRKIEEAENKSEAVIKNAYVEASKILESSNLEIDSIKEITKEKAKKETEETLENALKLAKKEYEPKAAKAQEEINKLENLDDDKFKKGINIIMERTVNPIGNS